MSATDRGQYRQAAGAGERATLKPINDGGKHKCADRSCSDPDQAELQPLTIQIPIPWRKTEGRAGAPPLPPIATAPFLSAPCGHPPRSEGAGICKLPIV